MGLARVDCMMKPLIKIRSHFWSSCNRHI